MGIINDIQTRVKQWVELGGDSFTVTSGGFISTILRKNLVNEYKNLPAICIDLIANDVARYEPKFYKGSSDNKKEVVEHPLLTAIKYPNKHQTSNEFIQLHEMYMLIYGEAFWYILRGEQTKKPKGFLLLDSVKMEVVVDKEKNSPTRNEVIGYKLKRSDGLETPFDLDEIIHFKTPNPSNQYRGIGVIQKQLLYIQTERNIAEFQNSFIKNQATPSGVFMIKNKISKEAFNALKKQWKESQSGAVNSGKTLFIKDGEADFKKIGLSLNELAMGDIRPLSKEDVLEAFGVPEALLGKSDSSGLGRSNLETIEYNFAKRNIDNRMNLIDAKLEQFLRLYLNEKEISVEHESIVPEDKEFQLKEDTAAVNKWKTVNEIRRARGLEEKEGGDTLYYSFNEVPIDQGNNNIGSSNSGEKDMGNLIIEKKTKPVSKIRKDLNEMGRVLNVLETRYIPNIVDEMYPYLRNQQERVIDALNAFFGKELRRKSAQAVSEVVLNEDGTIIAELVDGMLGWLLKAFKESGEVHIEFLGQPDQDFVITQAQRDALFDSTQRLMKSFDEQTAKRIQQQLSQAMENKETVEQMAERIKLIYDDATDYRARRIAGKELHKSTNYAGGEVYKLQGFKRWRWNAFPQACEFCWAMHGKVVTIGEPFIVKGETINGTDGGEFLADYEDVRYGDLHPYCDCRLSPEGSGADGKHFEFIGSELDYKEKIKELNEKYIKDVKEAHALNERMIDEAVEKYINKQLNE